MNDTTRFFRCIPLGTLALGLTALAACGSETTPTTTCGGTTNVLCPDGEKCSFSGDCVAGSICNTTEDPYYDSALGDAICVRLVCAGAADCTAPKVCSRERICEVPACQQDSECSGGKICSGGACIAAPNAADVASCTVLTPSGAIRQGATLTLSAVARNANGVALPGIRFTWASSASGAVAVDGNVATGGANSGAADLTAKVTDKMSVTCDRQVHLENFASLGATDARVVLVAEDNGTPVDGATVTLFVGGQPTVLQSGANGAVTFANVAGTIESVTVVKAGYEYVTVISPGTKDVFLPIPRKGDKTKAGGFRGAVDVASTRKGDLKLGIVAPAIPTNLLNLDFASILGDSLPTTINAPQLGLMNQMVDLPGGIVFGLGNERFTVDKATTNTRCQGLDPPADSIGCYVSQAPAGPGVAWTLAGRLKLQDVASIAGKLAGAFGGDNMDLPIGDILSSVLPLLRTLQHGINAGLNTMEHPKVQFSDGMAGTCGDAGMADYSKKCRGDFSKYAAITLAADKPLAINTAVAIPTLPTQGDGTPADGVVVVSAAVTESRGLVPLGLSAGLDITAKTQTPDGKINGVEKPFGPFSEKLADGLVPLTTAVPHSGIEGSQLMLLAAALDPNSLGGDSGIQLSGLVSHPSTFGDRTDFGAAEFMAFPTGTFNVGEAKFNGTIPAGTSVTRIELNKGDKTWLVYVPGNQNMVNLPDVMQAKMDLLSGTDAPEVYLQLVRSTTAFSEVFSFGSGKNLDKAINLIEGFVIQKCTTSAMAACKVQ